MDYFIAGIILALLHWAVKVFAFKTVTAYLEQAHLLLLEGRYTDGCSTPFKNYIHAWLKHSHDLCAAHDYGSLGFITIARPGWHNNWLTWLAHMSQSNPVYWIWGTIVALATLPWVVWRRNLGIKALPFLVFHAMLLLIILIATAFIWSTYYQ